MRQMLLCSMQIMFCHRGRQLTYSSQSWSSELTIPGRSATMRAAYSDKPSKSSGKYEQGPFSSTM